MIPPIHGTVLKLMTFGPQYVHVGSIMYGVIIFIIKLSILLQYLRIFTPAKKTDLIYWASHTLIWTNFVFYFVSSFLEIFACKPIAKVWDPLIANGQCMNLQAINVAAAAFNVLSDVSILVLPQKVIWKLHMSSRRKLGISSIFLTGIL